MQGQAGKKIWVPPLRDKNLVLSLTLPLDSLFDPKLAGLCTSWGLWRSEFLLSVLQYLVMWNLLFATGLQIIEFTFRCIQVPKFFAWLPLLLHSAVIVHLQRMQEVQGSILSQTTREKNDCGGFQFSFFFNPYGVNTMEWVFIFLSNDFLFESILTECERDWGTESTILIVIYRNCADKTPAFY